MLFGFISLFSFVSLKKLINGYMATSIVPMHSEFLFYLSMLYVH